MSEASILSADWPLQGMTCAACAASIERVLNRLPGTHAQVNLASERVQLLYDPVRVDVQQLLQSIEGAGFVVPAVSVRLAIDGMTCGACAQAIERDLKRLPQVVAEVNLAAGQVRIDYQPALYQVADLIECIERSGYHAYQTVSLRADSLAEKEAKDQVEWRSLRRQAVLASVLTLPLLLPMLRQMLPHTVIPAVPALAQWLLASMVQCWAGARFYRASWRALRGGHANMDVLVALGTSAAYLASTWALLSGTGAALYFDSSAVIICLILWGRLLESRARRGTTAAVRGLLQLQPERARVERDGHWLELDLAQVQIGDVLQVAAGESVPVDGEVLEGESSLDESMLSGEATPVFKQAGAVVYAATVNGMGWLRIRATGIGEQTVLARIIRMVDQAQGSKAPIQRLADRVAAVFVPAVLLVAMLSLALTWAWTGRLALALAHAVAVLVVACPCALGLATPTAIMVATGAAAKAGLLIRRAEVLEHLARLKVIALDKTGTLTEGRPRLQQLWLAPGMAEVRALQAAASLESGSRHPLAQALLDAAAGQQLELQPLQALQTWPGLGLLGRTTTEELRLGAVEWVLAGLSPSAQGWQPDLAGMRDTGMTVVALAIDGRLAALFGIADSLRNGAAAAIAQMRRAGLHPIMLTGDHAVTARLVAAQAGIAEVHAGILPQHKAEHIHRLQQQAPAQVAMVGDGINDAPALAAADVGFGIGSGSMLAVEAAGVVLMHSSLDGVMHAIDLSRVTLATIRQNLFFAFAYNVVAIPLAAAGYLQPMLAGAAMALSSISVVLNSLRLARWRPPALLAR